MYPVRKPAPRIKPRTCQPCTLPNPNPTPNPPSLSPRTQPPTPLPSPQTQPSSLSNIPAPKPQTPQPSKQEGQTHTTHETPQTRKPQTRKPQTRKTQPLNPPKVGAALTEAYWTPGNSAMFLDLVSLGGVGDRGGCLGGFGGGGPEWSLFLGGVVGSGILPRWSCFDRAQTHLSRRNLNLKNPNPKTAGGGPDGPPPQRRRVGGAPAAAPGAAAGPREGGVRPGHQGGAKVGGPGEGWFLGRKPGERGMAVRPSVGQSGAPRIAEGAPSSAARARPGRGGRRLLQGRGGCAATAHD